MAPNSACGVQTEVPQSNTRLYAACSEPELSKAVLEKLTGVCKIGLCRMGSPFFSAEQEWKHHSEIHRVSASVTRLRVSKNQLL